MQLALFEDYGFRDLLPLTWLRPACELRCGRDRLVDKITRHTGQPVARLYVRPTLAAAAAERWPVATDTGGDTWLLNSRAMVTGDLAPPPAGTAWMVGDDLAALHLPGDAWRGVTADVFLDRARLAAWLANFTAVPAPNELRLIRFPWELPLANAAELRRQCGDGGVQAGRIYPGAHLLNPAAIHVAAAAVVKPGVVLDAEDGPIHIDAGAVIQPNAVLEGPCYVGPGTIIRPGAVIRSGTTLGPVCRVGGEIEASIIHGYSNKQHDGFLGHSYVAEWVNLGADTVTSDLKNTYGPVRVFLNGTGVDTGEQFVGATIGDHAKTGIGTILPTGVIIGVAANVFSQSAVPKFVPSFAWCTDAGMTEYHLDKAVAIARLVMGRRRVELTAAQAALLEEAAREAREVESAGWATLSA
jgi:UDP-N-acetylglucosamine diphosphorylase/glucosamine-1-phosphate N-acetyltransferase